MATFIWNSPVRYNAEKAIFNFSGHALRMRWLLFTAATIAGEIAHPAIFHSYYFFIMKRPQKIVGEQRMARSGTGATSQDKPLHNFRVVPHSALAHA